MRKEHSAADWSTRPLPKPWLEYAALDVEVLVELREHMVAELEEAGKAEWARQEFDHLLGFEPAVRVDAWRRTSGVHRLRGRRALGAARALWEARDAIAAERDVTPGRILPDSAIVVAATAMPTDRRALLATQGFHGRGASRYSATWVEALQRVREMPEDELPTRAPRGDGPPHPRTWADRDAGRRPPLQGRARVDAQPRRGAPPAGREPADPRLPPPADVGAAGDPRARRRWPQAVRDQLASYGARPWQAELVTGALVGAILGADDRAEPVADDDRSRTRPSRGYSRRGTPRARGSPSRRLGRLVLGREDRPRGLVDLLGGQRRGRGRPGAVTSRSSSGVTASIELVAAGR